MNPWKAIVAVLISLQGCTPGKDLTPVERLDALSAVNTTIMAEPWVYARDVPMIAANSRDYVNVGLVETNRAGLRGYWLGVVAWSTVDRSALGAEDEPPQPSIVRLDWEDSSMEVVPDPAGRAAIGASRPVFSGPSPVLRDAWYLLSTAQLARLSERPPASVTLFLPEGRAVTYDAWKVDRLALDAFLETTGRPSSRR